VSGTTFICVSGFSALLQLAIAAATAFSLSAQTTSSSPYAPTPSREAIRSPAELRARISHLEGRLDSLSRQGSYLVIDTVHNQLQVRRGNRVLREATCATGSGRVLVGERGTVWRFTTPIRVYRVMRKVTNPIWKKPAWAFAEVGRKAPDLPWEFDRLDGAALGDYALELGDGFELHGTLYPNLLGRNITHGCIRLDDANLAAVYAIAAPGTRVYTY
jgi:hypothetical protein